MPSDCTHAPPGRRVRIVLAAVAVLSTCLHVLVLTEAPGTHAVAAAPTQAAPHARPTLRVTSTSVEHRRSPLGIDVARPRLGWVLGVGRRGARQAAYQVLVSTRRSALDRGRGEVWNSGRVASADSTDLPYDGRALRSETRYFWKVRVWDRNGRASAWGPTTWFETGFMDAEAGFTGQWIGRTAHDEQGSPEPLLRKEFNARGPVASARLHIAGLGYYVAELNGRRVGDHELDPGFTTYSSRVFYVTHDVTRLVDEGRNAIGVRLGRGYYATKGTAIVDDNHNWMTAPWRSEPKLNVVLTLTYADGSTQKIVSDTTWVTADGPTTVERPGNETYDARVARPGWTSAGYDDGDWDPAVTVPAPGGRCDVVEGAPNLPVGGCPGTSARLRAQPIEPQKVTRRLEAVKVTTPAAGTTLVYEFPTVVAGWARIVFDGAAGTEVKIRYAEKLAEDGTAMLQGLSNQEDTYILRGGGPEVYRPSYSYKGYKYVQVSAATLPRVASITGLQINDALRTTGSFRSSSPQLNAYHAAMKQTSLINLHSIPTDTPTFEKAGWTADAHLFGTSVMRNFDAAAFYEKFVQDIIDAQLPSGDVPSIVPAPADLSLLLDPAWAGAVVLVPYDHYRTYGDLTIVRRAYPAMKRWMSLMETQAASTGYIFNGMVSFGDWVTPTNGKVQSAQIHGTAYVFRAATLLAEMARAIGEASDAARWTSLAEHLREAYDARFFDAEQRGYLNGQQDTSPVFTEHGTAEPGAYAQSSQVEALAWGLVGGAADAAARRRAVMAGLVADVRVKGNHLATGASGSKWILPVLTDGGHSALAYKVALNQTYPGWGFWYSKGATTMWETWAENARSRGHAFMGTVDDWLHTHVAGLRSAAPGFRRIDYKPYPGGGLTYAATRQETPLGVASSCWRRGRGGSFSMDVVVPAGATGTVHFPVARPSTIFETGTGGRLPARSAPGVDPLGVRGGRAVFRVASGTYRFVTGEVGTCGGSAPLARVEADGASPAR